MRLNHVSKTPSKISGREQQWGDKHKLIKPDSGVDIHPGGPGWTAVKNMISEAMLPGFKFQLNLFLAVGLWAI